MRTDNDWHYHEKATNSTFQWNNNNFNSNYGGLVKNVRLHVMGDVYQTLPLYSNLKTTGVYVYAKDYDIMGRAATICVESEVRNETDQPVTRRLQVAVNELDGAELCAFSSEEVTIPARGTAVLKAQCRAFGLHFWSWGYGYLYDVKTTVGDDEVTTRTGFRKAEFKNGMVYLNDRVIMVHGYAQRTSNEWPGVGMSVPAWLSDYSNDLMVKSGGNVVRWMHVTPWKQDVESCDRVGLIQAMPAGDAEKDVEGRRWEQREELMRDAIIYNRNNPSILFYECGNQRISKEHMISMKKIRDLYDPNGGRAIGSREMLDRPGGRVWRRDALCQQERHEADVDDGVLSRRGIALVLELVELPLPQGRRRAALPQRACRRLQPQQRRVRARAGGPLVRLLAGAPGQRDEASTRAV